MSRNPEVALKPGTIPRAPLVAGALAAVLVAVLAMAGTYANPELLIETPELARVLGTPGIRIVDLRGDGTRGDIAYRAAHIPGAVHVVARDLDESGANAQGFPIPPDSAGALFGRLGIDGDTTVIAYDDAGSVLAARLFFVLEYYGHTKTRILNGGLRKWQREGRALTTEIPSVAPKRFVPQARRDLIATAEEVHASLGKEEVCLIDARSPEEYAGRDVRAKRGGHIPGAGNVDWIATLNPDHTFRSAEALRAIFEAAGVRPDRQIITYCQSGMRSAHDYFVLRLLGYAKVKNYDGSWNEWGNDPTRPVAK
ncbi:MAG: sulfurtransferase [Candidatus Rokuibacteriota bacterium]